jgi:hypothetical protein
MIQEFVERFMGASDQIKSKIGERHPDNYSELVNLVCEHIGGDEYKGPTLDPNRIHQIDDGDYQGTLVFVIAEKGYQPDNYYSVKIYYGSCSGCDTLESIRNYDDEKPTEQQVNDYYTLCLHIVQKLKEVGGDLV